MADAAAQAREKASGGSGGAAAEEGCRLSWSVSGRPVETRLVRPVAKLGRSADCDIVFPDAVPGISRHHATITREADGWYIADAQSRNGTFVNRVAVTRQRLRHGDQINLGPLGLRFELLTPGGPPALPLRQDDSALAGRVEFDDAPAPNVSLSISLADVAPSLMERFGGIQAGKDLSTMPVRRDAPSPQANAITGRAWGVTLFSEVGRALLSSSGLDAMLESILDLVFANVPGQRALICLCHPETGDLVPKAVKTRSGVPGATVRLSRSIADAAIQSRSSLLVNDVSADARFNHAASIRQLNIVSAVCVPLCHEGRVSGLIYVDSQNVLSQLGPEHLEVLTALSLFSAVALEQARLREEVASEQEKRQRLSRYHSPAVVDRILRNADATASGMVADVRDVSVLFSDLCGFTSASEQMPPADVVRMLNSVFELLSEAVFQYGGTLDKFMGDGMLAFFGAPLDDAEHAPHAVQAALRMQHHLDEYNRRLPPEQRIGMRIGINSGPVVVGDIGSLNRRDYTVIGDTVNVASRLESSVARPGDIVVGPETYTRIRERFLCEPLPARSLKGRLAPIQPYLVKRDVSAVQGPAESEREP